MLLIADDLRTWLIYVNGDDHCPCRHEWKGLGFLYGVSMGHGWVRTTTELSCPHHGITLSLNNSKGKLKITARR